VTLGVELELELKSWTMGAEPRGKKRGSFGAAGARSWILEAGFGSIRELAPSPFQITEIGGIIQNNLQKTSFQVFRFGLGLFFLFHVFIFTIRKNS